MRNTLATLASIAPSSQRPSLASCCASAQAWNRPARASTRSSVMEKVSNTRLRFSCWGRGGGSEYRQQATVRRIGGGDHRAAEADLAIVEDHRLSRGDRTLGFVEAHLQAGRRCTLDHASLVGLPVAGTRGAAEAGGGRGAIDPARRLRLQAMRVQASGSRRPGRRTARSPPRPCRPRTRPRRWRHGGRRCPGRCADPGCSTSRPGARRSARRRGCASRRGEPGCTATGSRGNRARR